MKGIFRMDGAESPATKEAVTAAMGAGKYFWLDLDDADPDDHDAAELLSSVFKLHPLSVEDAEQFGQRPKIEVYDDYVYLVAHGAGPPPSGTIEIHIIFCDKYTVTLRRGPCQVLDDVRTRLGRHHASEVNRPQVSLVYLLVDGLTDSFFPLLSDFDDRIDTLEDAILVQPTEAQLGELFDMKRRLMSIRKVITPERDMFASVSAGVTEIPGTDDNALRYFRDLYDHLIRISDMVDGYRDLLSGVMDTHISTVSNRLNVVMKQLAIIATVFLPLSFLTGFFGQNFSYLVNNLTGKTIFYGAGLGTEVVAIGAMVLLFWRRGWLGGPSN